MPKKPNIKHKTFDLPIYASKVVFIYGNDYDLILDYLVEDGNDMVTINQLKPKDWKGITFGSKDKDHAYNYVIVLKDKNKYEEIDTIAHEIFHLVGNILHSRGIKYNKNKDEPYAYLTGYLVKEFIKFRDGKG